MNFFIIFLIVLFKQLIFLGFFGLSVSINGDYVIILPILILIIYIIIHFIYSKKIYKTINLDKHLFYVYALISWISVGILITYLLFTKSWIWNLLPTTTGMFSGLEYILVPIFLILYLIILGIMKLIILIISMLSKLYITKKNN